MSSLSLQVVSSAEEKFRLPVVCEVLDQSNIGLENKLQQLTVVHRIKLDDYLTTPTARPIAILYDLTLGLLQLSNLISSCPDIPIICIIDDANVQDSLIEELFGLGISDYIELPEVTDRLLKKTIQKAQYRRTATNNSALSLNDTQPTKQQTAQQNSTQARADSISPEKQKLLDESLFRAELNLLMNEVLAKGQGKDIYQTMLEKAVDIIPGAQAGSMVLKIDEGYKFVAAVGFKLNILSSILFDIDDFKLPNWTEPNIANYYDDAWNAITAKKRDVFTRSASDKQIKAALSIPIVKDDEVVVIFNLDNFDSIDAFNDSATSMAQMFATQIGALQQRISLEESLRNEQKRLLDESSFRAELNSLMGDVLSQSSDEKIYQAMLEKAVEIIPGAEAGSMAILTPEGYRFVAAVRFKLEVLSSTVFNLEDFRPPDNWTQPLLKSYFQEDWRRLEKYKQDVFIKAGPSEEILSSLSIPILKDNEIVVIFNLGSFSSKNAFEDTSISMSQMFATHVNELWKRIQLEKNLRQEQKRLVNESSFRAELNALMGDVLSQSSDEKIYQAMLEKAVEIIPGAEAGSMAILTEQGYIFVAAVGFDLDILSSIVFNLEDIRPQDTSQPILNNYFGEDWYRLNKHKQEVFLKAGPSREILSTLSIPIYKNEDIVLVINLDNFTAKNVYGETSISMSQMFANQVEALWQRFELEKNLKDNEQRYKNLFVDADRSKKELEILDDIQTAIANKLELAELYNTVVKTIVEIFDFNGVTIGLIQGDTIVRVATQDMNIENDPVIRKLDNSIAGRIVKTKKPELINNISLHPDVRSDHVRMQDSMLAIPFCAEQEVLGILYVTSNQRILKQRDLALMQKVVDQVELAIENARLHEQIKAELSRTQALHKISESIHRTDNLQDLTQQVIDITRKAVSASWAFLHKVDFDTQNVETLTSPTSESPIKEYSFETIQNGIAGWAMEHNQHVVIDKNTKHPKESLQIQNEKSQRGYGSTLIVPIIYQNETFGVMVLVNHIDDDNFSDADIQIVQQFSNHISVAIAQHTLIQKNQYQAYHDVVTSLPNRFLFEDRLKQTLAHAERYSRNFAVLFLDLDGFKHINDTLGHDAGDLLLLKVSKRLGNIIRKSDTLARMGGDEFAIIIDELNHFEDAVKIAQTYQVALRKPFTIDNNSFFINASFGVSVYPRDGEDASTLLKHADTAMYEAKALGRNRVQAFNQSLADRSRERLELETSLRAAIEENSFHLVYQPKIDLVSGSCIGTEALIRWIDPELGFISPEKFIPIAEETGLITELGNWITDEACRQTTVWHQKGLPTTTAINISSVQFEHQNFVQNLQEILERHNLAPEFIELELTESMIMKDVDVVIQRLQELRQLGVSIAIDDFGTGYSSLSYLQKLPLDCLKIDRSFVDLMDTHEHQKNLVQTIISLANNFDLKVVAEGVETERQLELLKEMGCQTAQGYYFAKPLAADEVTKIIKTLGDTT